MEYAFETSNGAEILTLSGNMLSTADNAEVLEHVKQHIEQGHNRFIINLGAVKFINSNGLGLLINILTKSRKAGGDTVLAYVPDELSRLLAMTKLNSIFATAPSKQEALAKFKSE
jgi:anti-sigma B factor antagonist